MLADAAPDDEEDEDEPAPLQQLTADDTVEWAVEAEEPRPAPPAAPSYHFQTARAYDPPAEPVDYGPEEPGLSDVDDPPADDLVAGTGDRPAPSGPAAFDTPTEQERDVVAAVDELDDDEIDLDDYEELPEDSDLEGFEDATRAALDADPPARARSHRRRQGRERKPPDLEPIEPPVRSPSRRRRRRGPKPALLIAAGLLLLAVTSVLAAAGAFDGGGSGHDRASGPTIATTANSEADALARLRGAAKKQATGSRKRRGAAASGSGSAAGATTTGSGQGSPTAATTGSASGTTSGAASESAGSAPGAATSGTAAAPAELSWPAGRSAYTAIVYVSPTDRATAVQRAGQAARLGVRTGVLRSSDFANLEPGMWVAFAGVSDSDAAARRIADRLRAAGLAPAPYTRRVESR
jgi:hypothetical protein